MLRTIIVLALAYTALPEQVRADDSADSFFDGLTQLWPGSSGDNLEFSVDFRLEGDLSDLKDALEDVSALVTQSEEGVPAAETLLALARDEPARLTAALYQEGYYGDRVEVSVAGQPVGEDTAEIAFDDALPVPVTIVVDPGPLFRFEDIRIVFDGEQEAGDGSSAIAEETGLVAERPARSGAILATGRKVVAALKDRGYAFARLETQDVAADHERRTVSVSMIIATGQRTSFGDVEVRGAERYSTELLRSRAAIPVGEDYSPKTLDAARKRLAKLDGVAGARIVEAEEPDEYGRIPVIIDVTERKRRYFGANAAISSVDGAELNAYWGHRNVFGGGEAFRVEGTLSNFGGDAIEELEYEAKFTYIWPSVYNAYTDYLTSVSAKHEEPDSFESDEVSASVGVGRRFTPDLTGEISLEASWLQAEDALGANEFFLISLPGELVHDTRDNSLDPTEGWRATFFSEPVTDLQNSQSYFSSRAQV
ncbi:MAG: BamA/TamA family outer membrane protein, partial [Hyphomicrobiales bacterium]|nr:BamA/TamA family outer membrane protein [Hyphomicrobiales bacterium]